MAEYYSFGGWKYSVYKEEDDEKVKKMAVGSEHKQKWKAEQRNEIDQSTQLQIARKSCCYEENNFNFNKFYWKNIKYNATEVKICFFSIIRVNNSFVVVL